MVRKRFVPDLEKIPAPSNATLTLDIFEDIVVMELRCGVT